MQNTTDKIRLKSNDELKKMVSSKDQLRLRLIRVFKIVAQIAYEDMMVHPWKIPTYIFPSGGLGTTIGIMTCLYYAASPTKKSCEYRKRIKQALTDDISYHLYLDFMDYDQYHPHPLKLRIKDLTSYFKGQAFALAYEGLHQKLDRLPNMWLRRAAQNRLRRKLSKGELVVAI